MDDFLAELDKELSRHVSKAKLTADLAKARSKLISNSVSAEAKHVLREEYKILAEELNAITWKPEASVLLFAVQHCDNCGSDHRMFLCHMQRQSLIANSRVQRWERVKMFVPGLPREVIKQSTITHICADCCGDFDYDISSAENKFAHNPDPFTVSPNYHQEDVNAES